MQIKSHVVALISLLAVLYASPSWAQPVEYVKICESFGANYFYNPGTDHCVNAITGEVKTSTEIGIMHRQTYFTARVRALESEFCDGCFAVVAANGTTTRSELVTSSAKVGIGRYNVIFEKPVDQCAFNATLGSTDEAGWKPPPPGTIAVARTPNTSNKGVTVWTYGPFGHLSFRSFHLSLECKNKTPFCEVIDDEGTHACTGDEHVRDLGPPGP